MPKRIVQLLAIESQVKAETETRMGQLRHVTANPDLFTGMTKTYRQADDEGHAKLPQNAEKAVRTTADEVLNLAQQTLSRLWDTRLTIDAANQLAKADVSVPGRARALLTDMPVGHLLYLERELMLFATLVESLPVLEAGVTWTTDNMPAGQHKAKEITENYKQKVPGKFVLSEATQYHAANVQRLDTDEVVGISTTTAFSGGIDRGRKQQILTRVSQLRIAVKQAREEANSVTVPELSEGDVLFTWLTTGE